ncbi:hypothetical protein ACPVPU_06710 [Sphingomonas sp. CJ99]
MKRVSIYIAVGTVIVALVTLVMLNGYIKSKYLCTMIDYRGVSYRYFDKLGGSKDIKPESLDSAIDCYYDYTTLESRYTPYIVNIRKGNDGLDYVWVAINDVTDVQLVFAVDSEGHVVDKYGVDWQTP